MYAISDVRYIEARYWDGHSSAYGTGDQLLGMLRAGWQISTMGRMTRILRGRQFVTFMFELSKSNNMTVMIVIDNPFIRRLVNRRLQQEIWEEQGVQYEETAQKLEVVTMRLARKGVAAV
jgi:hypothetical protein